MNEQKIKILIVDDHSMIRRGLKEMLNFQNRFISDITESSNGFEALQMLKEKDFDIILSDISMPEMDGITFLRTLKSKSIKIPVLMITTFNDEIVVRQALDLGASGYILKNTEMEEITKAILTVIKGERYFGNEVAQMLFNENKVIKEKKSLIEFENNLSKREMQVLKLLTLEKSNQDIADELFISKRTVEWHRKNLLLKLNVSNTVGLVKFALKNGF